MRYIEDVTILRKWQIKCLNDAKKKKKKKKKKRRTYVSVVTKCNFILKEQFKIVGLPIPRRWVRRSGGIHMINSSFSPTTHPSLRRKCQITSFMSSSNVQILIVPSRDPDAKCIPSGKKHTELTLSI